MTSNGRQPLNIQSGISQWRLIESSSNLNVKLWGPNENYKFLEMKTASNEDDLKIIKSGITQQPLFDINHYLNFSSVD